MKLYFARHGESEGNINLLLYGRTDCPLTELGRSQARELGEKLREVEFTRCCASPLSRAAETARIAVDGRVPVELVDGFMEQDMGEFENTSFPQMRERYPELIDSMLRDWTNMTPPGGESYKQLAERASDSLEKVISRGEDTLIVAHNGSLSAIFGKLLGTKPSGIDAFWFNHGCYSRVDIFDGRVRLVYFNK